MLKKTIKPAEQSIFTLITLYPMVVLVVISVLFFSLFYNYETMRFNENAHLIKVNYTKTQKELIKQRVQILVKHIKFLKNTLGSLGLTQEQIKQKILQRVSTIRYDKIGYFFIYDYSGKNLAHPIKPQLVGENLYNLKDKNNVFIIKELINKAKHGGGYLKYIWEHPKTKRLEDKIGYALGIDDWHWMIGTGVYLNDINKVIKQKKLEQQKKLKEALYSILSILFFILLVIGFVSYIFLNKIKNIILHYNQTIEAQNSNLEYEVKKQTKKLEDLNQHLEIEIKKEVEKNRQKELQLLEQAKMVQLGEMIGNIAHQWRQPLNVISLSIAGLVLKKELTPLTDDILNETFSTIEENVQYLSNTIDTFRNFIKEKKEYKRVLLQERIKLVVNIIGATLRENSITLKIDMQKEDIYIDMVVGELDQVIINIINNAKDILIKNEIEDKKIYIEVLENNNNILITIEDNGGGVPKEIIHKIFDPYFTTKHQSQGTGLGLHMSRKIVYESLGGKLYVKNTLYGAKFYIELPKKLSQE